MAFYVGPPYWIVDAFLLVDAVPVEGTPGTQQDGVYGINYLLAKPDGAYESRIVTFPTRAARDEAMYGVGKAVALEEHATRDEPGVFEEGDE